jgi:2-desacetyl-2-hydroxyethyl bacteriochlorophyllide A dehydrogenase
MVLLNGKLKTDIQGGEILRKSLYHLSPGVVEIRDEPVPAPGPGQVLVQTCLSAISSGTEMLLYHGQFPEGITLDENIPSLSGGVEYPLMYGYAQVGEIKQLGSGVQEEWLGTRVFAFNPHTSHFVSKIEDLRLIPEGLSFEDALFFANMETAASFVMDALPVIGERVVVFGQGLVGLLTTALLVEFPLENLVTVDQFKLRRQASLEFGADISLEPGDVNETAQPDPGENSLQHSADLVFELSGSPDVLSQAIQAATYEGRILVGSWYGNKESHLNLGGWFHRGRLSLISSQVSRINSTYSGRWDKERRYDLTWDLLKRVKPARLITHKIPIDNAAKAFDLLDENPGETIQVILKY